MSKHDSQFIESDDTDAMASNNSIRLDKTFADVLLLVGVNKTPIYAHANFLSQNCEYYRTALADRWTEPFRVPEDIAVDPRVRRNLRAVLSHPEVHETTVNLALEFIYTKSVSVPNEMLLCVAIFADSILLANLKDKCIRRAYKLLSPSNSLDFYVMCNKLQQPKYLIIGALMSALQNLPAAIQGGKLALCELDAHELCHILRFYAFPCAETGRLLVGWAKALQGIDSNEDSGFDVKQAWVDIEPMLHFCDEQDPFITSLAESSSRNALTNKVSSPIKVDRWGKARTLDSQVLGGPIEQYAFWRQFREQFGNTIPCRKPAILYRATEHKFSDLDFKNLCKGFQNMLVLVETIGGKILGGYTNLGWDPDTRLEGGKELVFIFSFERNQSMEYQLNRIYSDEFENVDYRPAMQFGPGFKGAKTLYIQLDWCFVQGRPGAFNGKNASEFLGVSEGERYAHCEIVEYEVFEITMKDV
ncbi:hypothetical protein BCR33DRAFT_783480 [Rhizoclosmatium globosum]|uniref:BTB domain-containing protein n=1 Tax=Rhizoclosmatium globosum TaxID=329046 RepID=A0A1Y2CJ40_9FUNG|nr:hypothetical protein BCR33DRAFT_783480 [Rhizoclosmatium globosum]|eukprot:ORY47068.1 hypothetical protein BCR33DRAFT_783480 [Rhizoclosmatium globosum]